MSLVRTPNDYYLEVSKGNISGSTYVHKFGQAPDFDTGDGEVNMWDGADDGNSNLMTYTYSSTADIDRISSSDNGDTQDIEIQGLDTSGNLTIQTITLTGQTAATLSTSLKRVFRMKNVGSTDLAGRVYCFVNVTTTAGVPDTLTNIRAEINNGNNQTLMMLYTVPTGKKAYLRSWSAGTAGANKNSNYILRLKARPTGGVFQLKQLKALDDSGTSHFQHVFLTPTQFLAGTDLEVTVEITAAGITAASVSGTFELLIVDD